MRKSEVVIEIMNKTGIEKVAVEATVEAFMETIKTSMVKGENIFLRGFGTFLIKKRATKIGRNISKGTAVTIPSHNTVKFKPAKAFATKVKTKVKVK